MINKENLLSMLSLASLLLLASCGGGSAAGPGPGNGGGNGLPPGFIKPPQEQFQDLSPASDDSTTSWRKDVYETVPVGTAGAPWQNASGASLAVDMLFKINAQRSAGGLSNLWPEPHLDDLAQSHARDMALRNYFSHDSQGYGLSYWQRLDAIQAPAYGYSSENIAGGSLTADEVMTLWLNSAQHRDNMLSPDATHLGLGVYYNGSGSDYHMYWVVIFAGFDDDPENGNWLEP